MKLAIALTTLTASLALAAPNKPHEREKNVQHSVRADAPIWAADFSTATDSTGAGFGDIQVQMGGGDITDGPAMPVIDHPKLGKALMIHLEANQERYEAAPGAADNCTEGDEYFFRVDFVLDPSFPVEQPNSFSLINQIHHGGNDGSPPIEFDISSGRFSVRGASTAYTQDLGPIAVDTPYKLVYRVKFSTTPENSLLEVWVNDQQVLANFQPPCATMIDGNSYWKGATMYCSPTIPPLTVYQNAHRVGKTFDSVNA